MIKLFTMSSSNPFMPADPYELAAPRAMHVAGLDFAMTQEDERLVAELDKGASELGFHDQNYLVDTNNAFIVPAFFERDEPLTIAQLDKTLFEGAFATYAKVHIGRLVGGEAVRALCLSFGRAFIVSSMIEMQPHEILHVPVLAVNHIEQSN